MKRMYIIITHKAHSTRRICIEDLSKMYYHQKKLLPPLPRYEKGCENEKLEELSSSETIEELILKSE